MTGAMAEWLNCHAVRPRTNVMNMADAHFEAFKEASEAIQEAYIDYNQRRIHSSLGYMTPYEFLARVKVTQHDG